MRNTTMAYNVTKRMHNMLVRNAQRDEGHVEFFINGNGDVSLKRGSGYTKHVTGPMNAFSFKMIPEPKVE